MKKKGMLKATSVAVALCTAMSSMTFAFSAVASATTLDNTETVSASVTKANDNFSWDNASVYFLLTDRFRNGNTSNDHSYNRGLDQSGKVVSNIDDRATFHGGDFAGVTQSIEEGYFNDLGVNAIWISAPYEQLHGYVVGDNGSPSFAHYSYHGYYVLDYTQTDANFGTAEEFETLVDTAHEHGIRVIMDIVLNHSGYNTVYDMIEYGYGTVAPGWEDSYYSHKNVNNATYHSFIDYDTSEEDWANWWGVDWIRCGVAGYTAGGGSDLTNSLAGLPDFKTEQSSTVGIPKVLQTKWSQEGRLDSETTKINNFFSKTGKSKTVTNYLAGWLSSWVREYGVDGFRCDTAKHVEFASWKNLKDTCVDALKEWRANNPNKPGADWDEDFWMTGECWDHGVNKDGYYTQGGFDSMINFSTQGGGLLSSGRVKSTYDGFANAINNDDSFNVLSYVSSHDSVLARGDLIGTGSGLLLCPGGIQIFYGDETNRPLASGIAFDGNGGAGHSLRSDMNWNSMDTNVLEHWQKVGTFRNNHISVGAGSNTSLTSTSGYAFARNYNKNGITDKVIGCIYANANTDVTINVGDTWSDGQYLVNAYDQSSAVVSNGKVTFNSGKNGTILVEEPDGRPLMSVKGDAEFTGTQTVTVSLDKCEQAKCSVDGGNKFIVKNGDTITIGNTAYDGDTITITLEAENEIGSSESKATFKKKVQGGSTAPVKTTSRLVVKTADGSAPYVYAWVGANTELLGAWPGTKLTLKDSDGNYYVDLNTTESYNVVLNKGSDANKTGDIKGITGDAIITLKDTSYKSYDLEIVETPASPLEQLKKEGREVKAMTASDYTAASWANVQSVMTSVDALVAQGSSADEASVTAMITTLQNAKAQLKLNVPTIGNAVKGKNTVSGVAAPDSTVTVTVNGKAYTAQADDVTGAFTATTATLNSSSALTFKAERNGISSAAGSYNMSSGDITNPIIPTTPAKPTQPATQAPTTQPATQPTTQAATQATSATQSTKLNITSTSNYFPSANVTLENGNTLCLEYVLDSSMALVNAEWILTYDNTKLAVDKQRSSKLMPYVTNEVTNIMDSTGTIKSNFSEIQNLADFSGGKALIRVYFNVIGTGDTTVDLNLATLSVGYLDSSYMLSYKPVVRRGVVQTDVTSTPGFESFVIKSSTKATAATANGVTISFAAPVGKTATDTWKAVDLYYSNSTSNLKDANRIAMTDTGKTVICNPGDATNLSGGAWKIFEVTLTPEQVAEIDSYTSIGFAKNGSTTIKTVMYGKKTSVVYSTETSGQYTTTKSSIGAFDGKVFFITGAYNSNYQNETYTGYWGNSDDSKNVTISFAAPVGKTATDTWKAVDLYYSNSTSNLKDANRIAMTDTGKTMTCNPGDATNLSSGEWKIFEVTLTPEQVAEIDSYTSIGFAKNGSTTIKTVMYGKKTSVVYSTETSGQYTTTKSSIGAFDGKVFFISGAYNSNYQNETYTGYWGDYQASAGVTISFAAPVGKTATDTWTAVDLYYSNSTSNLKDASRIAMKDTGKTMTCNPGDATNLNGGAWKIFEVTLTPEQVAEIDSYTSIGFAKNGSTTIKTVMYGKKTSVVYSTETSGQYTTTKSSIGAFDGKVFFISGAYNPQYINQTYTGYWGEYKASEGVTISFAAPVGKTATDTWTAVDLYYSNSTSNLKDANRIAMKDTGKTVTCNPGAATNLSSGEWKIFEVTLTPEQVAEIDSYTSIGFAKNGSTLIKTVMYGKKTSVVYSTETSGQYTTTKSSIGAFDGKVFYISGAYNADYMNQTYTGYWK